MTYKKKIQILDSLFEEAKNLTEDPIKITQFKQDFVFCTKEVMQDNADYYLIQSGEIVFSPHMKQQETTSSINLRFADFQTAKEEFCRLIEKMRAAVELNRSNLLSFKSIDAASMVRGILRIFSKL
ncbi:MAG: hypothetical protein IJ789_05490 [Bacteroidales bacterium]|nr:hypothetical protein [Bacteroidales bacterium]